MPPIPSTKISLSIYWHPHQTPHHAHNALRVVTVELVIVTLQHPCDDRFHELRGPELRGASSPARPEAQPVALEALVGPGPLDHTTCPSCFAGTWPGGLRLNA
jgi:hypothetical protein